MWQDITRLTLKLMQDLRELRSSISFLFAMCGRVVQEGPEPLEQPGRPPTMPASVVQKVLVTSAPACPTETML